ncbi:hypothetical protein AB0N24_20300 [Arthrobacter sp. NPDC093128]|uniref:hypothetical protein n=1 Tax=Arthrobacter sp. NPDC093128 TaxID=3154979 RepID=UPI0034221269
MEISPEVLQLGTKLAESMARNGAAMITDKIRAICASARQEDVIAGLVEIISDLLDDKSELTRIASHTSRNWCPSNRQAATSGI